jgi:hypothetical protein
VQALIEISLGGHTSDMLRSKSYAGLGMGDSMKTARAGVRGVGDHSLQAKQLRDRAEECRILARMINVAYYLRLAESYDRLADQEERLARDIAEFEIESQQG